MIHMPPQDFQLRLMQLALRFPYRVTSGYRDPVSNAMVGGHPHSKHMTWEAVDVILLNPGDLSGFTEQAQRFGLKVLDESDHLHIQTP